jgi:N-methylhydantoinase B/oxoprolinase/acetone carboxylase alpha subunit
MDPELELLIAQAERNLRTLELLIADVRARPSAMDELQERIRQLREAYLKETNALTRQVLKHAVERRTVADRRRRFNPQPVGT